MKKGLKCILIIVLIAGIAFIGYLAYDKFFTNKEQEMEAARGEILFSEATTKTIAEKYFYVSYNETNTQGKTKISKEGGITIDERGYYHKWSGDEVGNKYVVNTGTSYKVFEQTGENKSTSALSETNFSSDYKKLNDVENLGFIGNSTSLNNEKFIKTNFYLGVTIQTEKFSHLFAETEESYIFKTMYKCTYINKDGKRYTSDFEREVYFDTMIRKVTYKIKDKEVDADGKIIESGDVKKYDVEYKIKYDINQALVKVNFSEYVNP